MDFGASESNISGPADGLDFMGIDAHKQAAHKEQLIMLEEIDYQGKNSNCNTTTLTSQNGVSTFFQNDGSDNSLYFA